MGVEKVLWNVVFSTYVVISYSVIKVLLLRPPRHCLVKGNVDADVVLCSIALIFNQNATTKLVNVPIRAPYEKKDKKWSSEIFLKR